MRIINSSKNTCIASCAKVASTFFSRTIGLLGSSTLKPGEALVIKNCKAVHMFFMRFAIDIIFMDKNKRVVGIVEELRPFRVSPIFWKATDAVELPEGSLKLSQTSVGDLLELEGEM